MARAHARRKTGRSFDHAHPGQAASVPRKRLRQLQKRVARGNRAQTRQNKTPCTIIIHGLSNWRDVFLGRTVNIRPGYAKYFGGTTAAALDYYRVNADLNRVTFEREVLSVLLSRGYTLEALEVEFDHEEAAWGPCVWYKEHPSYDEPVKWPFKPLAQRWANLINAMFKTRHAGDQRYGLFSTQMLADSLVGNKPRILLHKTLIYRKVVLAPPGYYQAAGTTTKAA